MKLAESWKSAGAAMPEALLGMMVVLGPVLMLLLVLLPGRVADRRPRLMARGVEGLAWLAFGLALLSAAGLIVTGPIHHEFARVPLTGEILFGLGVYLDSLSAVLLLLVTFVGAVVTRYSARYLRGEARQGFFMKWLAVTLGSVLLLIVSSNLVLFLGAWIATSLSLHQLLTFYRGRPAARYAARKKFLISRMGDLSLLGAIFLIFHAFGTLDFESLFRAAGELSGAAVAADAWTYGGIGFLLVFAAILKSAQFPFHSWLPDTMETPTPVSALMHAGIINAGGFLIVRLSPVVVLAPGALDLLAIVGAFTAVFAALAMLTQTSIKRSLAFSTVAQMGFMMLQCGLGAFGAAVLHIVAHSLYKAHAFLSSGSVTFGRSTGFSTPASFARPSVFAIAGIGIAALTIATLAWGGDPRSAILVCIFALAMLTLLRVGWVGTPKARAVTAGSIVALIGLYAALQFGAKSLLAVALPATLPPLSIVAILLAALVISLFVLALLIETLLPRIGRSPQLRRLYVHLLNGFYIGTLTTRWLRSAWPAASSPTTNHRS